MKPNAERGVTPPASAPRMASSWSPQMTLLSPLGSQGDGGKGHPR